MHKNVQKLQRKQDLERDRNTMSLIDKIKDYLLGITIFYGIVIIVLMIITYTQMVDHINVTTPDYFYTNLSEYKKDVQNVKKKSCRDEISNLIDFVEKHDLNGKVILRDYYQNAKKNAFFAGLQTLLKTV